MNSNSFRETTILIVDDSPTNLNLLSGFIDNCGWKILIATHSKQAIEIAESEQPDLILLDVMMPGVDGFETCQHLKNNPQTYDIPIIFMTAVADKLEKVHGLSIGAVDYITKPFQSEEVIARIKIHLKIRSLTQQLLEKNQELEQRVLERTAELSQALEDLKQSQMQLVQSEKMSTLGHLIAGVAHEINNPINFIAGNLNHASIYINDLINHLRLYQTYYPKPDQSLIDHADSIDLDYLIEDLPKLISSMKLGTDRISNISTSLRTFSRSDTKVQVAFNIHEGLESTLLILKHLLQATDYRPDIKIIKKYGQMPMVECYPGQLNQVFMNLINNAIDALNESSQSKSYQELLQRPNQIIISTYLVANSRAVAISIKDNGTGMSEETRKCAFDYLFTTKPVGKGTGLGLSISRKIIEDSHKGRLLCHSQLGEGSEFIIEIPICKEFGI
ncbi:Cyclic di-GMP phosphodiesterase PA4781 [Planktothrix tepida]|uniref:histidine kinase n=2 Tax=Planktothrix TaxID=54304 RepID=A0A1J1LUV5_9CYAN|nr:MULTISPECIES: response regulator [Planktothrix]CAD5939837.1 Cyclic di-GMP phosphodiesterase PA4781 [Planktothrix pseudagardhii]CAD5970962.1 Cyclic di-GMP phosphodiesterase PA4781 [Planktothrix tepida]CUR35361.1 Response regulator receiver sensor signal transduction histidinekinase [Planktothrix tepida PCC 9214]